MSERGLTYAKALPALITDNIGDAPLTVSIHYSRTFVLLTQFHTGVDVDVTADDPDGAGSTIQQAHVEIAG